MISSHLRNVVIATLLFCSLPVHSQEVVSSDIEAQPLDAALRVFAEQTGLQILYAAEIGEGTYSSGTQQPSSNAHALKQLLINTGLDYKFINENTVTILAAVNEENEQSQGKSQPASNQNLTAQAGTPAQQSQTTATAATDRGAENTEAGKNIIEEVLVTARKREENIQDVPISISAYSAADLDAKSLTGLQELAQFTPNFSFANNPARGRGGSVIYIRGVGQSEAGIYFDPGVGVYVDSVYLGRMQGLDLDLMDLERVEVLRGPQGTLFGKNTIGGAVNLVTVKPSDEFLASAEITIGQYSRIDAKADINVPLIPGKLAAKFAGATRNRDGYGERFDFFTGEKTGEMGDINNSTGRASFNWTAAENVNVLLSIDGTKVREKGSVHKLAAAEQPGLIALFNIFVDPDYGEIFLTDSEFTSFAIGPNATEIDTWGAALTIDWDFEVWSFKSISAYRDMELYSGTDMDGSPYQILEQDSFWEQTQFSQEFQFSGLALDDRLDWIFGLYYFEEEAFEHKPTIVVGELYDFIGLDLSATPNIWTDVKSYAVFGQGTYAISDSFSLTAGLRYTYDEKYVARERIAQRTGTVLTPLDDRSGDWDAVSGRVGLEYRWNDDVMTYISAARGFKSGGFNADSRSGPEFSPFDPEYIWTYEIGLRSDLLGRRLRFNTSFFYSDYTDIQFLVRSIDPETGRSLNFVDNAAKARVKGFEMSFVAVPASKLTLTAGLGFIDAEYTEVDPGLVINEDTEFIETPKWTFTASGQYVVPLGNRGDLIARLDYAYKTEIQHDLANAPIALQEAYGFLNARLTFQSASGNWEFSVFGTNLTDARYILAGVDITNALGWAGVQYARPREWGASLRYTF